MMAIGFSFFVLVTTTTSLAMLALASSSPPSAGARPEPPSLSDIYGCWGGCYNTCYVRNGQTDSSKLPCSFSCMNDCSTLLTTSSFGDGAARGGFCRLGCTLSSCSSFIYDQSRLQDCLNRCTEGCSRGT